MKKKRIIQCIHLSCYDSNVLTLLYRSITPVENNIVAMMTFGEGWHNYHHVFPWDYKTSEFGNYRINITTVFIDFFAYLGLAYDLQTAHPDLINKCFLRNSNTINYDKLNQ